MEVDDLEVLHHLPVRTVPVLIGWDAAFRDSRADSHRLGEFLIYPRSTRRSDLVSKCLKTIVMLNGLQPPNMRRMRTTWIVGHLENHVP